MHTLRIIVAGLALLLFLLIVSWLWGGATGAGFAACAFVPIWLACSLANLWIGVKRAGYSVREELPILVIVFSVPALAAWVARRLLAG